MTDSRSTLPSRITSLQATITDLQAQPGTPPEMLTTLKDITRQLDRIQRILSEDEPQNQLAGLYRISQTLGRSLHLEETLEEVMDAVIELTGAERGFLMLYDPETNQLDLQAGRNIEQKTLESDAMKISRSVVHQVLQTGEGIVTTNAQTDPRFSGQESVIAYALRSILCTPLQARGKILGAVYVDNRALIGSFTQEDLHLLDTFAAQAAIVIENARLYTRTDQSLNERVAELETLTEIDRELSARLDLDHVKAVMAKRVDFGQPALALFEQGLEDFLWVTGPRAGEKVDRADAFIEIALETQQPACEAPTAVSPSRCVIPMTIARRTVGLLVVVAEQPFTDSQVAFLQRLAARAAVAIENARLYQAVQDANLAKSNFVSFVAHELRLPMTSIKGYTDLILHGAVGDISEGVREFLEVVLSNVDRMRLLVSDLSDISRIETGRLNLEPEDLVLTEQIEKALLGLQPRIQEKDQDLTIQIPADLPQVYADPNRLIQILSNLISNASKYTPEKGQITISAQAEDGLVRITVKDTGYGISQEDQARLFSQFFRSEDSNIREQQGWGLGLNVTRNLVELMGGTIGVESVLGKGSEFWFTLPSAT